MNLNITAKKRINLILRVIALTLIMLMAAQLLATVIPSVMGYKVYAVLTPSMRPAIKVGSLVCVKPASVKEIQADDVCTFQSSKDKSKRFTHRVVRIEPETETFITRGDNNPQDDPEPVAFSQMVGKVQVIIPFAGIFTFLTQGNGVKVACILFMIFWLATEIELFRRRKLKVKKLSDIPLP